ncbi:MAG: hypothetical protein KAG61_07550 [Bacteriovoracaceae bacterium]|nr:hypothetical protein [Bacteriovoracaceae bacterium]
MTLTGDLEKIHSKYQSILAVTEPYLLTYPGNLDHMNLKPFGHEIPRENIISCIDSTRKDFFNALQMLDKLSFGPVGMPMEKWVFFDCGEMVGAIYGLAVRGDKLDAAILKQYSLPADYTDLVPVSMYIAIPMAKPGAWFGHNLCSANSFLAEHYNFSGLAVLTKALGVKTMNIHEAFGATQWESGSLNIHLQLANMEVHSSYTPAHSFEKTMTYRSHYTDEKLLTALSGTPRVAEEFDFLVDVSDPEFYKNMQKKIEAKEEDYTIVGRPVYQDGKTFLPLKKGHI